VKAWVAFGGLQDVGIGVRIQGARVRVPNLTEEPVHLVFAVVQQFMPQIALLDPCVAGAGATLHWTSTALRHWRHGLGAGC
jgi:hypothetical protein